ncbi:hypothetical protein BN1723_017759, partial [Verticillium longisporum]
RKQPVADDAAQSPYTFVGYSTIYRFFYFQAPSPPASPAADWELPKGDFEITDLPCRTRLSQFVILPPFQGKDANCTTGDEPISDTTRDQMFMEAVDCFVSRIPDAKARQHITFQIAEEWHMSKERVEHYLEASIPQLEDGPDQFRIGRVKLRKKKDRSGKIVKSKRPFANTTHAKKLLEQAAVAVKSGEPVLLVGETGIGKTTVIQRLADTLGHKLIAVNLSQQIPTTTTSNNLESLAGLLKDRKPILLHGLPGSGKTSVIHEFAKEFGKHPGMVTLHINEQTDAKMLVGLYAADSKPGSFSWRPGVLTTAVREGRWVLIEDLDRAPNEVISTLLPLIERGQLLIPSRGETIEASSEFRLFATVRTTKGMHGRETLPNLLGLRFWQQLSIQIPSEAEFLDIIVGTYPVLRRFAPEIMAVFRRLTNSVSGASRNSFNRSLLDRQPSSRDLLRWCRRLASLLADANCTTGDEPISDTTRDQMFMEAVDCFVSRIPDAKARQHITFQIAEEWHMSKERGGRKGLPSSFVNRFIVVYADVLTEEDLLLIAGHSFPDIPSDVTRGVIRFITKLDHQIVIEKSFGLQGGPWEFNLRDILRWLNLLASKDPLLSTGTVDDFLGLIVRQRFRSNLDRKEVDNLFASIFGRQPHDHSLYHDISTAFSQVGNALIARNQLSQPSKLPAINIVPRLPEIESVMICVKQNIPCIIGGPSGSGKSALLQHVAAVAGKSLVVFPLNADIDTMDLVGGFEQADPLRELNAALRALHETLEVSVLSQVPAQVPHEALSLLHALEGYHGNLDALEAIAASVQTVLSEVSPTTEIAALLTNVFELLQKPLEATDPRFEWLDGVIVKALQTGQWLVLDNANLCNASVLDRLNS